MPARRADARVSLAAGLYAAGVLGPGAVTWLLAARGPEAAALAAVFGGSGVAVAGAALFSQYGGGVAVRIGGTPLAWLLPLAPLAPVLALAAWRPGIPVREALVAGGVLGLFAGTLLVLASQTRHARAATPDDAVTWTAAPPAAVADRRKRLGVALLALGALGFLAGAATAVPPVRYAGQWLVPVGVVLATTSDRDAEYAASDAGLTRHAPVHAVCRPWTRFRGYEVTDDAVVLRRRGRWRWLPDPKFARDDLENENRVVAALDAHLPRD